MKYYLYRHIRLDEDQPFYIGFGKKTEQDEKYHTYTRANTLKKRNSIWHRIHNKTEIKVEILLESDNSDFVLQKEREFVKLYGRINLGTGTLANLTEGGDGTVGYKHSEESKLKMSKSQKGRLVSQETKDKIQQTKKIHGYKVYEETKLKIGIANKNKWKESPYKFEKNKIYLYNIDGNKLNIFIDGYEAENITGFKRLTINNYCRGNNNHFYKNHFWFYEDKGDKLNEITINSKHFQKEVLKIDIKTNEILKTFVNAVEAGKSIRANTTSTVGCIREVCIGGRQKTAYGFKWKYK